MKVPALELDKPNGNNRTYPRQVLAKALSKGTEFPIFRNPLDLFDSTVLPMDQVIGFGVASIEDDRLMLDCNFKDGDFEKALTEGELHVRPGGIGTILHNEVRDDYRLHYFFLTDKPA